MGWHVPIYLAYIREYISPSGGSNYPPIGDRSLFPADVLRRYGRIKFFFIVFLAESNHLKKFNVAITPEQLAEDFKTLRYYLTSSPATEHAVLVGPDVTQPQEKALKYLER